MEFDLRFEWDPDKNDANVAKHGVSFYEAQWAFRDEYGQVVDDIEHSETEDRYVLIGSTGAGRLLVVFYCYRNYVIRIISARKANRRERARYLRGLN